ncbi:hypothetical protein Ddye_004698 [Dipteronia dyeriana]|uniref:Uncharacterized protein n=1 Tax=Dipteronia dyeriana TaxID=168575 RepID=A0AAE0CNX3_9ROSI|nr:hypothetical protein Ddye_004698 [Dipteronia dyeriana]
MPILNETDSYEYLYLWIFLSSLLIGQQSVIRSALGLRNEENQSFINFFQANDIIQNVETSLCYLVTHNWPEFLVEKCWKAINPWGLSWMHIKHWPSDFIQAKVAIQKSTFSCQYA